MTRQQCESLLPDGERCPLPGDPYDTSRGDQWICPGHSAVPATTRAAAQADLRRLGKQGIIVDMVPCQGCERLTTYGYLFCSGECRDEWLALALGAWRRGVAMQYPDWSGTHVVRNNAGGARKRAAREAKEKTEP